MSNQMSYMSSQMGLRCRVGESSTAQESVMALLMDHAGKEFTETRVRELLGLPKSTTHRALKELADQGLLSTTPVGRTITYRMDPSDPLVRHLKIARAISRSRTLTATVRECIETAVLFGSAARGEDTEGSDLDLFVVASDPGPIRDELARREGVQAVVMTPSEHMRIIAEGGTFARAVADGILIAGRR